MLSSREPDFFLGDWRVRPQLNLLESPDADTVAIEPRAMETLVRLASRPGEVMRKERLIAEVWGEAYVTEGVLTRAICQLRQALGDDPREPRFIQTVPRRGYRLVAGVSRLQAAPKEGAHVVGPYRVGERMGGGAMGVVHKAEDTRLRRPVALKFLAAELARDPDARSRFLREARAASALDHPHIGAIYDVGEGDDGELYIAMAFYEGETLKKRVERGPLAVRDAIEVAAQIAEGLAAAHAAGIVHRDLKPANVMCTAEGSVKLLDFGLAKLADTTLLTLAGRPLGTPAYMAPEQALGEEVDHRSDLWSLGVVLYQMLSGELPFGGESSNAILYAIAHEEPRPLGEHLQLPPGIAPLLDSLLRKDPAERYSDSAALPSALRGVLSPGPAPVEPPASSDPPRPGRRFWTAAGLAVILVAAAGWWYRSGRSLQSSEQPPLATMLTTDGAWKERPHLAPDGELVAYEWVEPGGDTPHIYVKLLEADASPVRITDHAAAEASPAWSPDGRQIAFVRLGETAAIYVKPWLGGRERMLAELEGPVVFYHFLPALSWSPDGKWLAFAEKELSDKPVRIVRLSLESLEKQPLTFPPDGALGDIYPRFSPDGRQIAFARRSSGGWGEFDLCVQPIESGQARCLTSDWYGAFGGLDWMPDGRELVFTKGGGWFGGARLFRLRLDGSEPRKVVDAGDHMAAITVSGTRMVYQHARTHPASIWRSPGRGSALSDRVAEELITSSGVDDSPAFSPDGTRVAFTSYRGGPPNIWVANSDGTEPVQLTHFSAQSGTPHWSPDGRWIIFDSEESGNWDLWVVSAEGGTPRRLTVESSAENLGTWSRDGRWIYFTSDRGGVQQIWRVPADGGEATQITQGRGFYARESWDGGRLYYTVTHSDSGIWSVPAGGGPEIEVVPGPLPMFHDFALSSSGIYYVTHSAPPGTAYGLTGTIHFFDFDSRQTSELIRRSGVWGLGAVAVSPDEEWILYRALPRPEVDLVLVDNFR